MRNLYRRLHKLERLHQFQPPPSSLELIRSVALQTLSQEDLDLLYAIFLEQAAERRPRELSTREAAACAAWAAAVETEARRMGFKLLG